MRRTRGRYSQKTTLASAEWTRLRATVQDMLTELTGVDIHKAVDLISKKCPTNATQLRGLAPSLRVWSDPPVEW